MGSDYSPLLVQSIVNVVSAFCYGCRVHELPFVPIDPSWYYNVNDWMSDTDSSDEDEEVENENSSKEQVEDKDGSDSSESEEEEDERAKWQREIREKQEKRRREEAAARKVEADGAKKWPPGLPMK